MSNEPSARRRSLIALAILLPAVIWMSAYEDFALARQKDATDAIEVMPGQAASFAGADWRLLDLKATKIEKTPAITQVEARLQISFTSPPSARSMRSCRSYLEDSAGQRWSAQPSRRSEISCAQLASDITTQQQPVMILERFVIPTHRAVDVSLAIVIPKERPRYLRFQRS